MKIMYISHRFETNICATMHLKALREYYGEDQVFVVDLRTEEEPEKTENKIVFGAMTNFEKILRTIEGNSWYLNNARINKICSLIKSELITTVFIDESIFGNLVATIKKRTPQVKVITFYHDIAQDLYVYWRKTKGKKFAIEMRAGIKGEKKNQKFSDVNLVLNNRDKEQFIKYFNREPEGLLPVAVAMPDLLMTSADEFDFSTISKDKKMILFVGSLYQPNIDGLKWYVENVFSELDDKYCLIVIGRGLEKLRSEYSSYENIIIIGKVKELAPYYNNADVVIAPLFDGGGMKQKTAEAFAYGKPFIGTMESLQGYEQAVEMKFNGKKVVFSCESAKEQILALDTIEQQGLYGMYPELTAYFETNYSVNAIKRELTKWIV